jgi:hypothetical protein
LVEMNWFCDKNTETGVSPVAHPFCFL